MDWFNSDQRQMDDFVNSNNWHVPPIPDPNATPSPGLPTNMEITSSVSTDEYDIYDIEPAEGRGRLAKNFVDISEDAIIGNQQSGKVFWQLIAEKYNAGRPRGSFERSYVKLRKHWGRVQKEMNKWNGKWTNVVRMWPSGHNEMDLVEKAKADFFSDGKKHFKYFDVWKLVEKSPKYTGGAELAASGAQKGTKVSAARHFGQTTTSSSHPLLTELTSRDTSTMSEFEVKLHHEMIGYLCTQMKK
ncbi:uncharacterized protein LOC121754733 [Salvia splendens]|uniref:uncharacterized protein LOC121754733 n=1 Tax=Salvia splendens TaxID=180675 RepID=UPI001C251804|nr:uncharacterized protein LOC121754733 [Salvia splendens]